MKKKLIFFILLCTFMFECKNENETKELSKYMSSYNYSIDDFEVICFVPVDGCGSCINPTIKFVKDSNAKLLVIFTSIYKKSITFTIESYKINKKQLICDSKNNAVINKFVSEIAPCYYFIKNGQIVKKTDLNLIADKVSVLKEVEDFLEFK